MRHLLVLCWSPPRRWWRRSRRRSRPCRCRQAEWATTSEVLALASIKRGAKARCRMHGGAPGSGAPKGNRNALQHGRYTARATAERRHFRQLLREARELIEIVG